MKITIAYQEHEKARAKEDVDRLVWRHSLHGTVKVRQSDRYKPYYHTYLHITDRDEPRK